MILSKLTERRGGFTLIELLVVMGIIGILVSLVLLGASRTRESSEKSVTSANMQKIASALDQHLKAVADQANTPPTNSSQMGSVYNVILQYAGNDVRRGRALWLKANIRREFPVSFNELTASLGGLGAPAVFKSLLPLPSGFSNEEQSAMLLYLTLTTGRRGVTHDLEQGIGSTGIAPVRPNSPFKVFVDAWGTPIVLVRVVQNTGWLNAAAIQAELNEAKFAGKIDGNRLKSLDSTDREGLLTNDWNPVFSSPNTKAAIMNDLKTYIGHPFPSPGLTGQGNNYNPFIASAGPDQMFGTDDDLYSFRMREAGQRGD